VLRALEMEAQVILKATNVDGVYTADPKKDPNAKFLPTLTFQQALVKGYAVMDANAFGLCKENKLPSWCSTSTSPARRPGSWPENASARSSNDPAPAGSLSDHVKHAKQLMDKALKPSNGSSPPFVPAKRRPRYSISCASRRTETRCR